MATITWTSGLSADWDIASNWSTGLPTSSDTVSISQPGNYDITIGTTESVSIENLYLSEAELTVIGALILDDSATTSVIGPSATFTSVSPNSGSWSLLDYGSLSNQGTIAFASAGGFMPILASSFANSGVIIASSGAQIEIAGATLSNLSAGTLTGGTWMAVGSGSHIDIVPNASFSTTITVDAATITLSGSDTDLFPEYYNTLTNSGTFVTLESTLATIAATGVLNLLGGRGYAGTLALTDAGLLTLQGGVFAVPGLIVASGGTLVGFGTVDPSITGSGVVQAQGGTLDLLGGVANTDQLMVGAGAAVETSGSLAGPLVNLGTVIVSGASLDVTGSVSGSGGLLLGANATLELATALSETVTFGGANATASLDLPYGFSGTIADFVTGDTIDLAGVIATAASLVGTTLDLTNNGSLAYALTLANAGYGSTYQVSANGTAGISVTELVLATVTWDAPVSADWSVVSDWVNAAPSSIDTVAIAIPGTYDVTIAASESYSIDSLLLTAGTLADSGALVLNDSASTSVIGPAATFTSSSPNSSGWNLYDDGSLSNQGTIAFGSNGGFMSVWANVLANSGVIMATGGAQIEITGNSLSNLSAGTLTGGTWLASGSGSHIDLVPGGAYSTTITADAATITLSGAGSEIDPEYYSTVTNAGTFVTLESSLATIAATGVLNLEGGRGYSGTLALTDDGLLNLGGGSLAVPGLVVASGGTLVGFGTVTASITGSGVVEASGGTLDLLGGAAGSTILHVDAGATLITSGSLTGTLVNQGSVGASGAWLKLSGGISGSGGFIVAAGSVGAVTTLEIAESFSQGITFGGDYAALSLDLPHSFTGTISGFGAGDTIDLAGIVANAASLVGTTLDLTYNGAVVDALPLANPGSGLTYSATPNGAGGTALSAIGQGCTISFDFDPAVASAPAGFEQAMTLAADALSAMIQSPISVTIEVGWGEFGNGALSTLDGGGVGGPAGGIYLPYSEYKADFLANETDAADVIAGENLPVTDPTGGAGVYLSNAQEQAWGLLPQNDNEIDGIVAFGSAEAWNFGTSFTTANDDAGYLIGVAEHEITHAMGRINGTDLNLFRYEAPGTLQPDATGDAYFSVDGGTTDLDDFESDDDGIGVDNSDWMGTPGPDPFNYYYVPGVISTLTPVDFELMSVLGFDVSCFASGTCLLSERGEVAVEHLRVGECLPARFSGTSKIIWIGHQRVDCRRHPQPEHVWPIRIRPGAFAADTPRRDLFLSPEHAVLVDGVLIPIRYLINGTTILQEKRDAITYWHVELERHDVILAEGVACETYLDTGNRQTFAQGDTSPARAVAEGVGVEAIWEAAGCARLLTNAAPPDATACDLAALLQPA